MVMVGSGPFCVLFWLASSLGLALRLRKSCIEHNLYTT